MAAQANSTDYGSTTSAEDYVAGIKAHIWLAQMYELMMRTAILEIRSRLQKYPGEEIVIYDLGCGPGHFTMALAQRIAAEFRDKAFLRVSIKGIDKSPSFLAYAFNKSFDYHFDTQRLVTFHEEDVMQLDWQPVHIVTVSGVIHHFPYAEQRQVVAKIATLLREDGLFIHGDEHLAPDTWFEEKFPGHGHRLALCSLYFQVIAAALRSNSYDLKDMEIENFLTEVYRDDPEGVPRVERGKLMLLVEEAARLFMCVLVPDGLESACREFVLPLFEEIERAKMERPGDPDLHNRGDYKTSYRTHYEMVEAEGFRLLSTYDTGDHMMLGSAPVSVFRKRK